MKQDGKLKMKKVFLCLSVILLFVLLVSCETLGYSSTDYSSSSSFNSSKHNSYYVKSYSSILEENKTPITKGDFFIIGVDGGDYNLSRPFELKLSKTLEQMGFRTDVMSNYDLTDKDGEISSEKYGSLMRKLDPDFVLIIDFDDVYVFETGGGISRMSVSTTIWNERILSTGHSIMISSIVEGENNFEKYYSSLEGVIDKLTDSIVDEMKQYISK